MRIAHIARKQQSGKQMSAPASFWPAPSLLEAYRPARTRSSFIRPQFLLPDRSSSWLRRARVQLIYWWRYGATANLREPRHFTEHVQRRKLQDWDERFPALADKVAVKDHIRAALGKSWVIPTLWRGSSLPEFPPWAIPFIVKAGMAWAFRRPQQRRLSAGQDSYSALDADILRGMAG